MTNIEPLVSIMMPVYNPGPYFRLAVLSILQQTYQRWELLIVDDGTTDGAFNTIADIKDVRVRILRDGNNLGLARRLNQLIEIAEGDFFARMDADDVAYRHRLAKQVEYLLQHPATDLVATGAITIDSSNRFQGTYPLRETHEEICSRPWLGFYMPHPTWMARAGWFKHNQYAVPAPYLCEDQELLLRSYRNSRFAVLPEILFAYRVRNRIAIKTRLQTRWSLFKVFAREFSLRRKWDAVLLVFIAFLGRLILDIKLAIRPARHSSDEPMTSVQSEWMDELSKISNEPNQRMHQI